MDPLLEHLQLHLNHVAIPRDPDWSPHGHAQVKRYIHAQLAQWGSVAELSFDRSGQSHSNLILKIPGQKPQRDPILIGAHFDAVPGSPGADDNASGIAVLLELARYFSQHPPRIPVQIMAFDLEERGLLGSTAQAATRDPVRLMISLEMLGYRDPGPQRYPHPLLSRLYPRQGTFIALVGNPRSLLDMIHLNYYLGKQGIPARWLPVPNGGHALPDTRRSDHAPFWDRGHRAIMVTDTANLRNPHYHRPSDTVATLDLAFMTGIARGLMKGLGSLR